MSPAEFIALMRTWIREWGWMNQHPSLYSSHACEEAFEYMIRICVANSTIFRSPAAARFRRIVREMKHLEHHPRKQYYLKRL
jgi:hypothetical protein